MTERKPPKITASNLDHSYLAKNAKHFLWNETPPDDLKGNFLFLNYYSRAFHLIHLDYMRTYYNKDPHHIRKRFWQFAIPREYSFYEAKPLLDTYISTVEKELAEAISPFSIAYWLHTYRRLFPGPIGEDTSPQTIGLTRALFEAAIQKYASSDKCPRIGLSKDVPVETIFSGLLMDSSFDLERELLQKSPINELVLTNFSVIEMKEFYDTEKLAYEIWRAAATLRCVAKDAPFIIEDSTQCYRDDRSDELHKLLSIYDNRHHDASVTATGTVYKDLEMVSKGGFCFLPIYNLGKLPMNIFEGAFRDFNEFKFPKDFIPNFIWIPFNLRGFREVHKPLASEFYETHHVDLDAVLTVVAALSFRYSYVIRETKGFALSRYWQRAYEGPKMRENIIPLIIDALPYVSKILNIPLDRLEKLDFPLAIDFWTLTRSSRNNIDLAYSGPHCIFLPIGKTHYFIDYAWIHRRLFNLFHGVWIQDQNFKGDALEKAIKSAHPSILPSSPCETYSGEKKQIDFACALGRQLIIAECKAVALSIGFDRGDPTSINYRIQNVVERSLNEADEKARWLANNPKGKNYDISMYEDILPIGISPFVEYIPSRQIRYWISDSIPRVLTIGEFNELITNKDLVNDSFNRIKITR